MKRLLRWAVPLCWILPICAFAQWDDSLLKPYVMNHRAGGASVADVSFLLDGPAGKTGFVHIQGGIMVHIDKGGDKVATKKFFDKLNSYQVNYDVIGQSYYPWWHGTLLDLRENLMFMSKTYQKDIIVVEAAYCWAPSSSYRNKPAPFPETPEGQKEFWEEVNRIVLTTPEGRGIGLFWWEPAVAGGRGGRGFFDENGNALPVMTVFDKFTRR